MILWRINTDEPETKSEPIPEDTDEHFHKYTERMDLEIDIK